MGKPNAQNVSVGKPHGEDGLYAGGMWWALVGDASAPTNATTPLDTKFKNGGYLSDDGVTNSVETDSSDINAFGGDRVLSVQTSRSESFSFGMIETTEDTLALVYGPDNVTVSGEGDAKTITVKHNGKPFPEIVLVFEFALTGDRVKRIVVPVGKMGELDDVEYTDEDAITYTPTINAFPDENDNTAYEYIAKVAASVDMLAETMAVYDEENAPSLAKAAKAATTSKTTRARTTKKTS